MFTKDERSTFKYWFAHWCSYQMCALNLHIWRPRFLFHDIWKPWLKLFLPYKKLQKIHRMRNNHHVEYIGGPTKLDYVGMLIDWECSRFTKLSSPLNMKETCKMEIERIPDYVEKLHWTIPECMYFEKKIKETYKQIMGEEIYD